MKSFETNKHAWNQRVDIHFQSDFYDVPGFLKGKEVLKPIELAVIFAKQLNVNSCVFGFATIKQINDFFYCWNGTKNSELDFSDFDSQDKNLYDVRRW